MSKTPLTFLEMLSAGQVDAWREVQALYRPMIVRWLRRFDLQDADCEDLAQDVLTRLHEQIPAFEHNGRIGAFRRWLRTVTANRAREFYRSGKLRPRGVGTTTFQLLLEQLENPDSDLSRESDREHDERLIARALERVSGEFAEVTRTAFALHVIDGLPVQETADQLGITPGAVYIAKSRILRRLRDVIGDWLEDLRIG